MLSLILERLHTFQQTCPLLFHASLVALILLLTFLGLVQYFKPVGKRKGQSGIKPRLPPGPAGIPLFGSLFTLKDIRTDHDRQHVSSILNYTIGTRNLTNTA